MNRAASLAGAAVLVLTTASSVAGQSLGESARKAEEQRKAVAGQSTRIELVPSIQTELKAIRLDKPTVEHYVGARVAMAKMWHRDVKLYERVLASTRTARTLTELVKALTTEAQIVELFTLYGYSAEDFLSMEASIVQAQRLTEGGFDMASLTPTERENYQFAGRHMVWLSLMRGRIHKAEAGMSLWQ